MKFRPGERVYIKPRRNVTYIVIGKPDSNPYNEHLRIEGPGNVHEIHQQDIHWGRLGSAATPDEIMLNILRNAK